MWKQFLRWLARIGIKAAAETVAEQVEKGPVTAENVLKPAVKGAAATVIKRTAKDILNDQR